MVSGRALFLFQKPHQLELVARIINRIAMPAGTVDFAAGAKLAAAGGAGIEVFVGPRRNRQRPHSPAQPDFLQLLAEKRGMPAR